MLGHPYLCCTIAPDHPTLRWCSFAAFAVACVAYAIIAWRITRK